MFKDIGPEQIKSMILIGLILGSIFFVRFIPLEITHSEAFKQVHSLDL